MDAATFKMLPDICSQIKCPVCGFDHDWSTREAWLGNPPPSAPALPWLFINNLSAANDWFTSAGGVGFVRRPCKAGLPSAELC